MWTSIFDTLFGLVNNFLPAELLQDLDEKIIELHNTVIDFKPYVVNLYSNLSYFIDLQLLFRLLNVAFIILVVRIALAVINLIRGA